MSFAFDQMDDPKNYKCIITINVLPKINQPSTKAD
jgi:hypothetical protein